jgi:hypothetical protein
MQDHPEIGDQEGDEILTALFAKKNFIKFYST